MDTGNRFFSAVATSVIWGAVALMIMAMSDNANTVYGSGLIWVMLFAIFFAGISTRAIWRADSPIVRREGLRDVITEKAKRTRVQKLLNVLNEEELDELRSRLSDADGEISLDELLSEKRQSR